MTGRTSHLTTLLDAFERHGESPAVVYQGSVITYNEARDEVYRLAAALRSCGLRRGQGVAALVENNPGFIFVQWAAQLLGCYFVAIEKASEKEQMRLLGTSRATTLVFDGADHAQRADQLRQHAGIERLLCLGANGVGATNLGELVPTGETGERLVPLGRESDIGELVFTGGSSGGEPKAAAYSFGTLADLTSYWIEVTGEETTAEYPVLAAKDNRLLRCAPFASVAWRNALPTLLHGGTLYLHEDFDAGEWLAAVERERITSAALYPAQLGQILDHPNIDGADTSSLRMIMTYGSAMSPTRSEHAIIRFGPVLINTYGQSETNAISVLSTGEYCPNKSHRLRSVGRLYPFVDVAIRAPDGQTVQPGDVGEIYVRTPYRMDRYWNQPALTEQTIVDGWVRTGDLGFFDSDDYLYLVDRIRDMVIVNATNCYSSEIEAVLCRHPAVQQAAVVGLPDNITGEAVHAAVVPRSSAQIVPDDLRLLVRGELSELHEPKTIVVVESIPLTRRGKPDKNAVRAAVSRRLCMSDGKADRC